MLAVASDYNTMAASVGKSKRPELSKAEYLKRYLSTDEGDKKSKGKIKKKRRKVPEKGWVHSNVLTEIWTGTFCVVAVKLATVATAV